MGANGGSESPWTVLVYMAGDNSLKQEMVWGLQELKKVAGFLHLSEKGVSVVAYFDPGGVRSRSYDIAVSAPGAIPPGHIAVEDGSLGYGRPVSETYVNAQANGRPSLGAMGAPGKKLSAFVEAQIQQLPLADQYFVVLSGHGSGAEGDFLSDSDPFTSLSIPELGTILKEAQLRYTTRTGKPAERIAVLGLDSCLMSNAEVCYELIASVDLLIASEGFVENTGWPYHRVLEAMLDGPSPPQQITADAKAVATQVAVSYAKFYRDYEISDVSTDIAVCKVQTLKGDQGLEGKVRALAGFLIPKLEAFYALRIAMLANAADEKTRAQTLQTLAARIESVFLNARDAEIQQKAHGLSARLGEGSTLANEAIRKHLEEGTNPEKGSKADALRELRESLSSMEPKLSINLVDLLEQGKFQTIGPSLAPALARAKREFDPRVNEAIDLLERLETADDPQAKDARELLLKFHHVRQILEIAECGVGSKGPSREERQFLDALMAARWEAQSFKGSIYVDLLDLCQCFRSRMEFDEILCKHLDAVITATKAAIRVSAFTGADFQHAHGLSVYFPVRASDYTPKYENLQFATQTLWGRVVRTYLAATRRTRRDEESKWFVDTETFRRCSPSESDPLSSGGIEDRIIGRLPTTIGGGVSDPGRSVFRRKLGTSENIRLGTSENIRLGTSENIRGEIITQSFGNPPDGFYRRDPEIN